jgi:hypothetical protein
MSRQDLGCVEEIVQLAYAQQARAPERRAKSCIGPG